MSFYYDPVTHRFLNSDGYFQSGGGILDANMNAYCRNNPIMCVDPSGTTTWRQVQELLASGEATNYTICDVTNAQIMGYGPNDDVPFLTMKNACFVSLGSMKVGSFKGYTWKIHPPHTSVCKTHIHIEAFGKKYSQNIDGSPCDGSSGSPPNSIKKHLKNNNVWDWDANQERYELEQASREEFTKNFEMMQMIQEQGYGLCVIPLDTCLTGFVLPQISYSLSNPFLFNPAYIL